MLTPFLACVTILVLLWLVFRFREHDDLDKLPGPRSIPFFGAALSVVGLNDVSMFKQVRMFNKLYGDRYCVKVINRRLLQVSNPHDVEVVLSSQKNITKGYAYGFLEPWLGTGLLLSTGNKWRQRRKVLTPAFHFNILKSFADITEERSRKLISALEDTAGADVDVLQVISQFTLHTICETAMGTQLDLIDSSNSLNYKKAILDIGFCTLRRLINFWLQNELLWNCSETGKKAKDALHVAHEFADQVINERKRTRISNDTQGQPTKESDVIGAKKKMAMLDLLLDAEGRGEIDLPGIKEEVNTFMFEGHDTTAMGLTFAIMLLADHRDVQDKIYEECETIFNGSDRPATVADLSAMKYLEAVIKETLRLYPSVPFISRMVVEDFMLGDLQVKAGTEVGIHIFDLHRRPSLYPEPEQFRPERFLGKYDMHPFAYVPFSAGPRNCIGQKFAMQEMKCVLSDICRAFVVQPKEKGFRPALASDLVLRPAEAVHVRFVKR